MPSISTEFEYEYCPTDGSDPLYWVFEVEAEQDWVYTDDGCSMDYPGGPRYFWEPNDGVKFTELWVQLVDEYGQCGPFWLVDAEQFYVDVPTAYEALQDHVEQLISEEVQGA